MIKNIDAYNWIKSKNEISFYFDKPVLGRPSDNIYTINFLKMNENVFSIFCKEGVFIEFLFNESCRILNERLELDKVSFILVVDEMGTKHQLDASNLVIQA